MLLHSLIEGLGVCKVSEMEISLSPWTGSVEETVFFHYLEKDADMVSRTCLPIVGVLYSWLITLDEVDGVECDWEHAFYNYLSD